MLFVAVAGVLNFLLQHHESPLLSKNDINDIVACMSSSKHMGVLEVLCQFWKDTNSTPGTPLMPLHMLPAPGLSSVHEILRVRTAVDTADLLS